MNRTRSWLALQLADKPRWVTSLVIGLLTGGLFAMFMAAFSYLRGVPTFPAIASGIGAGLVFGAAMGWFVGRQAHAATRSLAPLSATDRREALRAARTGPAPESEGARRAALRMAEHELAQNRKVKWLGPVIGIVMTANSLFLASISTPWWLLALLIFLPLSMAGPFAVRWGKARVRILKGEHQ